MSEKRKKEFVSILRARMSEMKKKDIEKLKKRKIKWTYPFALERKYHGEMLNVINPLLKTMKEKIKKKIVPWKKEAAVFDSFFNKTGNILSLNIDSWSDQLQKIINQITKGQAKIFGDPEKPEESRLWKILLAIFELVNVFNKKQWFKQTKNILGVPFPLGPEKWMGAAQKAWMRENYRLFKRLSDDTISKLNEIVSRGDRTGARASEIQKEI